MLICLSLLFSNSRRPANSKRWLKLRAWEDLSYQICLLLFTYQPEAGNLLRVICSWWLGNPVGLELRDPGLSLMAPSSQPHSLDPGCGWLPPFPILQRHSWSSWALRSYSLNLVQKPRSIFCQGKELCKRHWLSGDVLLLEYARLGVEKPEVLVLLIISEFCNTNTHTYIYVYGNDIKFRGVWRRQGEVKVICNPWRKSTSLQDSYRPVHICTGLGLLCSSFLTGVRLKGLLEWVVLSVSTPASAPDPSA